MIITDENLLRVDCADVLDDDIGPLREALEAELKSSGLLGRPGIGLAAPQIGVAKRMAIVRVPSSNGHLYSIDLVNAEILNGYDKIVFDQEGCLSFPDLFVKTLRFNEIHVSNNYKKPTTFIATGMLAICIQHELDHLRGKDARKLLPDIAIK